MNRLWRTAAAAGAAAMLLIGLFHTGASRCLRAEHPSEREPAPPAGQAYAGAKSCAVCHFKQFLTWRKTKHSKAYDVLTDKYQAEARCLKCHTTGYGEPTGFKSMATTPQLAGNTCETCHGPGSKHVEICEAMTKKVLSDEEKKRARDSIWKVRPENVCVACHKVQGHGSSETPEELRKKDN